MPDGTPACYTELAARDAVTGLMARAQFRAMLDELTAEASGQRLAVIIVDIRQMLCLNEAYGCEAGDLVLRIVADRLRTASGEVQLVARTHGAGFLALAPLEPGHDIPANAIDCIIQALAADIPLNDDTAIRVESNIGLAVHPDHGRNSEQLLRAAEVALQRARREPGTGFAVYESALSKHLVHHERLRQDLYEALARNEFVPYYQPQFSLSDGRIMGFEALVRWRRPNGEVVMPGQFVPLAEETGLVKPLGEAMLRAVIRDLSRWRADGLDVPPIAVNISPCHLHEQGFPDRLLTLLAAYEMPAKAITLELTETACVQDLWRTQAIMDRLSSEGIRLSVDDFGTGFSSLKYLARLPLDVLKVDRTFVQGLDGDSRQRAVAEALVRMGTALGLTVIAEGVEKPTQVEWLIRLDCHGVQGFLYGWPAPAERAELWIAAGG